MIDFYLPAFLLISWFWCFILLVFIADRIIKENQEIIDDLLKFMCIDDYKNFCKYRWNYYKYYKFSFSWKKFTYKIEDMSALNSKKL